MSIIGKLFGRRRCYRCALPAKGTYAGFDYCPICLTVVPMMMPAVAHDPPFGFPGQRGYDPLGPDPYTLKREGGKP